MDFANVITIARKEIRDSIRNRWFQLDAIAFAVLALSFSYLSLAGSGSFGFAGFGKTAAGLVNLVLLVVPLMAITIGAGTIAGDAERGSLAYLLAQPVSRAEVLFGKYLGLATALSAALALGFGISGIVLAANGVSAEVGAYAALVIWALFLALAMLSVGFFVSVLSRKVSVATGAALFLWLALAFLSDLGLMGGAIAFKLRVPELFGLAMLNPLQSFKLAVLRAVHSSLDVLGPAGIYAAQTFGSQLSILFSVSLAAWVVAPLAASQIVFQRRGAD
jgi:Cu-processing system permease protein